MVIPYIQQSNVEKDYDGLFGNSAFENVSFQTFFTVYQYSRYGEHHYRPEKNPLNFGKTDKKP
jgi:hypothetical protein